MPETMNEPTDPDIPADEVRCDQRSTLTRRVLQYGVFGRGIAVGSDFDCSSPRTSAPAGTKADDPELPWLRINWEIKALVPIACVLLGGMLLFLLATLSWRDPERHIVLLVAGAGAVAICGALLVVLTYTVQRPMVELQQKIAQLGGGDLSVAVSFARRNDEIGDLGRNFNQMVQQLRESRVEIERLHRTQMSRAEHLATLGEMATGLAHEIRNPLAGIAGVIEIIGRDLPATSPARSVVKDVRQEIARINHIVTDLLQTARPHPPKVRKSDLNTTVEHAVMLGRQQALAKSVEIALHKDPSLPEVEHDSDQIHQVLLNLLLNALQAIDAERKNHGHRESPRATTRDRRSSRQRPRHRARPPAQHLPALLHHQRRRHRPGIVAGPPHRRRPPRPHRRHQRRWARERRSRWCCRCKERR